MGIIQTIKSTIVKPTIKIGGWLPDPANKIYWKFDKSILSLIESKIQYKSGQNVDLRPYSSPRHNQGSTSSCVGNGLIKALEIKRIIQHGHSAHVDLSRSFLYYYARARKNPPMTNEDSGCYIYIACDVMRNIGVCSESLHPFSTKTINKCPSQMAARECRLNRIKSHFKIKSQGNERLDDIIFNLQAGNPVVFGTTVGQDWIDYKGGTLGVETRPIGGHALTVVGHINGLFIIENSWGGGSSWGEDGFAYVKPEVLTHPSTRDLWVIVDGSEAWTEKK